MRIVDRIEWNDLVDARVGEHDIDFLMVALDPFVKPSDVGRVGDVTLHADAPWPISLTASASSSCRRPVMYTCAPSMAKSFAVARPMPSLPPVITTTLFSKRFVIFWYSF